MALWLGRLLLSVGCSYEGCTTKSHDIVFRQVIGFKFQVSVTPGISILQPTCTKVGDRDLSGATVIS